jgi:hypothetical protein
MRRDEERLPVAILRLDAKMVPSEYRFILLIYIAFGTIPKTSALGFYILWKQVHWNRVGKLLRLI